MELLRYLNNKGVSSDIAKYSILSFVATPLEGLMDAAERGSLEDVQLYIQLGADVNGSPLIMIKAARNGHLKIIKYLLKYGARFLQIDKCEERWILLNNFNIYRPDDSLGDDVNDASHAAALGGHLRILKFLRSRMNIFSCWCRSLQLAAYAGHLHTVKYLHPKMENLKYTFQSDPRQFALRLAIKAKHLDVIKYFHRFNVAMPTGMLSDLAYKYAIKDMQVLRLVETMRDFDYYDALEAAVYSNKKDIRMYLLVRMECLKHKRIN